MPCALLAPEPVYWIPRTGRVLATIIERRGNLTLEEQAVESSVIAQFASNPLGLVQRYRDMHGKVVGTDLAREVFPEYGNSPETRLKFALAVQKTAACLADLVFSELLAENVHGTVLFTAGGTGAGKTGAITRMAPDMLSEAHVIYDSNFNSHKTAFIKVDLALSHKRGVDIVFVHRHPVEAYLRGVIPRALREGRTVAIQAHLRLHRDALKVYRKAINKYGSNKNVGFTVLNNTGHEAEVTVVPIEYLEGIRYHNEADLHVAIQEGLDNARKQKIISEELYQRSCASS